jgi:hypothetical protein
MAEIKRLQASYDDDPFRSWFAEDDRTTQRQRMAAYLLTRPNPVLFDQAARAADKGQRFGGRIDDQDKARHTVGPGAFALALLCSPDFQMC